VSLSIAVTLFLASLMIRLPVVLEAFLYPAAAQTNDSWGYRHLAAELLQGRFPSIFRTPGYPLLLALTGAFPQSNLTATFLVQVFLDSMTGVLLAAIVWRLLRDRSAAVLTGLLWALCPVAVALSSMVMSEALFGFLAVTALYLAVSRRSPIATLGQSLCWSAAVLTRPSGVLLPILASLFLVAQAKMGRRRLQSQAAVLLLYLMTLAIWLNFNYRRTGTLLLCSVPDVAVYMYELPAVQMADQLSWAGYIRAWVLHPREAERIREEHEKAFIEEVSRQSGPLPRGLWSTIEDPHLTHSLRSRADVRLRGRILSVIGTHVVGALQSLRPMPPWALGGLAATLLDGLRLTLAPVAIVILVRRHQWWLLMFLGAWIAYALLLPGVCGVWRYRSLAEPALTMLLAVASAPVVERWPLWGRLTRSMGLGTGLDQVRHLPLLRC
jgi:hypothetical protein